MSDPLTGWMPPGGEPDEATVLPPEFTDVEAEIQRQVGVPQPAPERLITPLNPEGKEPSVGMGFEQNVRGAFRSSGALGSLSEQSAMETVRDPSKRRRTIGGDSTLRSGLRNDGVVNPGDADTVEANRQAAAYDAVFDQAAYDLSQANLSGASVAGSVIGTMANPENFAGLEGFLVSRFKSLASRPVVTSIIDNALVNTATDAATQAQRTISGGQEGYDPLQTALAAVIGGVIGGGVAGLREIPSFMKADLANRVGRDMPTPGGEPARTSVETSARFPEYQLGEAALNARVAPMEAAPNGRAPEPDTASVRQPGGLSEGVAGGGGQVRSEGLALGGEGGSLGPSVGRATPEARFGGDFTERPLSAQVSAPKVADDLGVDIPGTLLRELRGEPATVTAWHGTPHDFDRFDMSKIGTGEGAQAYGHGLYFAESHGVAKGYRDTLSKKAVHGEEFFIDGKPVDMDNPSHQAAAALLDYEGKRADAIAEFRDKVERWKDDPDAADMLKVWSEAARLLETNAKLPEANFGGSLYQVRINANPDHFLDWDKPLSEQSEALKSALRNAGYDDILLNDKFSAINPPTPEEVVKLREAGIPGIKYLDAGSRSTGDGTRNFVVFDDKLIQIIGKDGKPVPLNDYLNGQADAQFVEAVRAKPITPELKADLTPPAEATDAASQIVRAAVDQKPATVADLETAIVKAANDAAPEGMVVAQETVDAITKIVRGRVAGRKPLSLLEFIGKGGGLALDGEAKARDLNKVFIPGGGPLARKSGKSIDGYWREALMEAGYFPKDADGYATRDITKELFDAIDQERAGRKVYSANDAEEVGNLRPVDNGEGAEIEPFIKEIVSAHEAEGISRGELSEGALVEASRALARGDETDPLIAYERAVMEQSRLDEILNQQRTAWPDDVGDLVFRKRGSQPTQSLPPDMVQKGRPVAASGQPAPAEPVRVQRLEDLSRSLVDGFETTGRQGRVTPGARGQYGLKSGVIRVKSLDDFNTVAHEVGHAFHLDEAKADVDALVARNAQELQPLGSGDKKGDMEAFAELFRLYVSNPVYAAKQFPNAFVELDALLRNKFPERHAVIQDTIKNLDAIHRAESGELVTADTISTTPPSFPRVREAIAKDYDPSGRTLYSAADALYTASIDKDHPLWKAVEGLRRVAKDNGKDFEVLPADDPYILMRLAGGSNGVASTQLEHGVVPANGVGPQGPSAASGIEKALGEKWDDQGFKDFGAYLTSRRMVAEYKRFMNGEIPNPPGKFSLADYQKAVAEYEAKYPTFADGAKDIYDFQMAHLKRAYEKGLYTKEYYDAAVARQDYVPFVRDMADFKDAPDAPASPSSTLRYSVMKTFRGSQRSVQNPLESIFKKVHDLEFVIARNDAVNAMARLVDEAGPGSGAIGEHVPSNQLTAQKVDVIEALRTAGKKANVDEQDLKNLILQTEDLLGDSTVTTLFRQAPISDKGEPIVYRWVNGERQALRLADGRFGREMYHAFTAMSDVERTWFVSALQVGQQILRAGVTRSPDFLLVNFIRDQFTATGTAGRYYTPFVSAVRGMADVWNLTDEAKAYAARGGMAAGAITEAIDRADFGRNVWALEKAGVVKNLAAGDVLGAGSAFLHKTVKALELSEASTRMGLFRSYFKQAKEMGFDDYNATLFATFRATDYIDFRKAGSSMGLLRRWVPFMNAALQGTDREVRAMADLPVLEAKRARGETLSKRELDRLKDARVAWVRVMTLGAMVGGGLALMNADKPEYQSAPEFTRNTNFLFKVGDTWIAMPKPFGTVQSVVNAFERGAEYAIRKDPALFGTWLSAVGEAFKPPMQNPFVSMAYDIPANYDRFRERPIVPFYMQGVDPSEQYMPGVTSSAARTIGQLTGWSPMKVDYFLRGVGGSMATNLLRSADMLWGNERPERQVYDLPVVGRFAKNLVRGNAANNEFMKLVGEKNGEYEQKEAAYRNKVRNGERAAAEKYYQSLDADHKVWVTMQALGLEANEKRLHPMQNARDHTGVISGVITQLNLNNVIRESEVDRQNTTISRRQAQPMLLVPSTRAKLVEAFQELSMASARNAMVAVEAKGTRGLPILKTDDILARIKAISPEVYDEYMDRRQTKKIADPEYTFKVWPEVKARVLRDGENADLTDLVPRELSRTRRRKKAA